MLAVKWWATSRDVLSMPLTSFKRHRAEYAKDMYFIVSKILRLIPGPSRLHFEADRYYFYESDETILNMHLAAKDFLL